MDERGDRETARLVRSGAVLRVEAVDRFLDAATGDRDRRVRNDEADAFLDRRRLAGRRSRDVGDLGRAEDRLAAVLLAQFLGDVLTGGDGRVRDVRVEEIAVGVGIEDDDAGRRVEILLLRERERLADLRVGEGVELVETVGAVELAHDELLDLARDRAATRDTAVAARSGLVDFEEVVHTKLERDLDEGVKRDVHGDDRAIGGLEVVDRARRFRIDRRATGEDRNGNRLADALQLGREVGREVLRKRDTALRFHDRLVGGENQTRTGECHDFIFLSCLLLLRLGRELRGVLRDKFDASFARRELVELLHEVVALGRLGVLLVEDLLGLLGFGDALDERLGDVLVREVLRLKDVLVALLGVRLGEVLGFLFERRGFGLLGRFLGVLVLLDRSVDGGKDVVLGRFRLQTKSFFDLVHGWVFLFLNGLVARISLVEDRLDGNVRGVGKRDRDKLDGRHFGGNALAFVEPLRHIAFPDGREEAETAVGDGLSADIGKSKVADETERFVKGEVGDPRGGGGIGGAAVLAFVLEVAENLLRAVRDPLLDHGLDRLRGDVLDGVAVGPVAGGGNLDGFKDIAGFEFALGEGDWVLVYEVELDHWLVPFLKPPRKRP